MTKKKRLLNLKKARAKLKRLRKAGVFKFRETPTPKFRATRGRKGSSRVTRVTKTTQIPLSAKQLESRGVRRALAKTEVQRLRFKEAQEKIARTAKKRQQARKAARTFNFKGASSAFRNGTGGFSA